MDNLILWLMLVNLLWQAASSLLAPFYPDIAKQKIGLSSLIVGLIMASFSFSYILNSIYLGYKIGKIGRRTTLYLGLVLQAISMIGFGFLEWIENKYLFIGLSFFFRLLAGVASSFICVAAYAMATVKYKENLQSKIGLLEAANAAGLFTGPIFGGLIYEYTFFSVPFFTFAGVTLIWVPFLKSVLTEELDANDEKKNVVKKVGYLKLLSHKRIFFAALTHFFNLVVITSRQPIFGPRLSNDYGFSKTMIGFWFALPTITFILFVPILNKLLKHFEWRAKIMFGYMILITSMLLMGPSKLLNLPDLDKPLLFVSLWVMGVGMTLTVIPVIPEMIDTVSGKYEDQKNEVKDAFSAMYNIANGIGWV